MDQCVYDSEAAIGTRCDVSPVLYESPQWIDSIVDSELTSAVTELTDLRSREGLYNPALETRIQSR